MATKTIASGLLLALACLAIIQSCKKDPAESAVPLTDAEILDKTLTLPATALNYANPALPSYVQIMVNDKLDNTPMDNRITNDGATLGRVLFYDKLLSANNTVACASCHKQANGFADPVQFSTGFAAGKTTRNAMSLVEARYFSPGSFLGDLRAASLEEQVLLPIQHPVEMGLTLDELESRLSGKDYYRVLFKRAFGDEAVTRKRVALALAQFVRSLVSFQSKFDEGIAATSVQSLEFTTFTTQENNGMMLFRIKCGSCNNSPMQIASQARNNGLDAVYQDNGLGEITHNAADNGKFKTPSLRNIAVTAPYMHDGRFATLAEVIKHYNEDVQDHPALDITMREGGLPSGKPKRMNLTQVQQEEIIAFLNTLTDEQFLRDVKFSDPFRR